MISVMLFQPVYVSFLHFVSQNSKYTIHCVLITYIFSYINTSVRLKLTVESRMNCMNLQVTYFKQLRNR